MTDEGRAYYEWRRANWKSMSAATRLRHLGLETLGVWGLRRVLLRVLVIILVFFWIVFAREVAKQEGWGPFITHIFQDIKAGIMRP
jgi:hypothetical protein